MDVHPLCVSAAKKTRPEIPNDNGPSPFDEGPLDGHCPVLTGVADGIQNGDL